MSISFLSHELMLDAVFYSWSQRCLKKTLLPRLIYPGPCSVSSLSTQWWVACLLRPCWGSHLFNGADVAGFWVCGGPWSRGSPSASSPGSSSASGWETGSSRASGWEPGSSRGGNASGMQSWEYRGVRAEKEEPSQGGSPQEAAEGQKEGAGAGGQEQ